MFLSNAEIKNKVKSIIADDVDNDIIFIVGNKGIGKTQLLHELYGETAFNREVIVTDGKRISSNTSNLAKCFIEGITKYIERNNRKQTRQKLCDIIKGGNIGFSDRFVFAHRKKLNFTPLLEILSDFTINKLKRIYFQIAEGTPLVIVLSSMMLSDTEVNYLCDLSSDTLGSLGARVTFVLGIRTNSNSIAQMVRVLASMEARTWILPLLPEVTFSDVHENPKSIPKLSLSGIGVINSVEEFRDKLSSSNIYFEMFSIVRQITDKGLNPRMLFLLANQEITIPCFDYLAEITKKIYNKSAETYDHRLMLPADGRILWLDVLSYYYALLLQIDAAIVQTQNFFLALIIEVLGKNDICYYKSDRNAFISFIKEASKKKNNLLAPSFSEYYSDFATMVKVLIYNKVYKHIRLEDTLVSLQILDRVTIDFSKENFQALYLIYENTQLCSLIDIGINTIQAYIVSLNPECSIPSKYKETISCFLHFSMSVAYKWLDITIIDEILDLEQVLINRGEIIRFYYHEPLSETIETSLYDYFLERLSKKNISLGDINMKGSIFLSYTHNNTQIADEFDVQLQAMAYEVKRDIREVDTWSNLKEYMKTIRFEDNVIFLVSDDFLRKDNCMYEVMQFMKDDARIDKAYPVALEFSDIQKKQREIEGKTNSMFTPEYLFEIVMFWQNRAKILADQFKELDVENAVEFAEECREKKEMAQSASKFIHKFFGEMLVGTYKLKNKVDVDRIIDIVLKIDNKIQTIS